ncbi:para-nitrobenzyl esterase [Microdochium nivale]|nr:para-nitrobenzyl esterase [Microdochium nivale]
MPATLHHVSLRRELQGVELQGSVWQFRGIPYAAIAHRFSDPEPLGEPVGEASTVMDCTSFGPRCPQNPVDYRHLLRVPADVQVPNETEDEFACLNLDVTIPSPSSETTAPFTGMPVFVWIHGGSQTVSFGTSSSGLCDPRAVVAKSAAMGQPIVAVNVNYRLNMFAFGDGASTPNLALRDQRSALVYVRSHIAGFGGDPDRITMAGESAGAVYCHAHMVAGAMPSVRSWILQSGTLALSPPQPDVVADGLVARVEDALRRRGGQTLRVAPVSEVLAVQAELGVASMFLREEEELLGWRSRGLSPNVDRILVGDTEYESVLWRNGIELMSAEAIVEAFDGFGEDAAARVRDVYGIYPDRPVACKLGALDFLHDMRFSLPIGKMIRDAREATERSVFRYIMDEPNPWQRSSRAHHGVDLLYLFQPYDLSFNPAAREVAHAVQEKWIAYISGLDPWPKGDKRGGCWVFGPCGESQAVGDAGLCIRRRIRHMSLLEEVGLDRAEIVVGILAAGRASLLN